MSKRGAQQRRRHAAEVIAPEADDPMLAAEQFASMCKGFGDLERRFGAGSDRERDKARIAGAVDAFLRAYAPYPRSPNTSP